MKHIIKERIAQLEEMIAVRMPLLNCNITPEERESLENRIRQYEAAIENLFICLHRYDTLTQRLLKVGFMYDINPDIDYWVISFRRSKNPLQAQWLLKLFRQVLGETVIPEIVENRVTLQGDIHYDNAALYVDGFRLALSEEQFWELVSRMEKDWCFAVAFRRKYDPEDREPHVYDDYDTFSEVTDTAAELTDRGYENVTVFRMHRDFGPITWELVEKYRTDKLEQYL